MTQRVELHLHTTYSDSVSVITPRDLILTAVERGLKAVAITDRHSVQSFSDAQYWHQRYGGTLKLIYGAELVYEGDEVTVLAMDRVGLKALYRMVSGKHITPEERKHLLVGTGFPEQPEKYDYIELLPNNDRERNQTLYELGKKWGIPVVAVSDCRCILPEEAVCVQAAKGCRKPTAAAEGTYLRTAEEMLEGYAYLGEEAAREVVLTNPEQLADRITQLTPLSGPFPAFVLPDAFDTLVHLCEEKLGQLYGTKLQKSIRQRILEELDLAKPYASHYLLCHKIVKHLHERGDITGTRGTIGSTLLAYLLEISNVNPLPAHYYCKACKHVEFAEADSGYDLPEKTCPHCGGLMVGDGQDIPYETCMLAGGGLPPDIDINVPRSAQSEAMGFAVQLLGKERVAYAGVIACYTNRLAESCVRAYEALQGEAFSSETAGWMREKLANIKRGEYRHPGGIVLLPEGMEWEDVTPVRQLRRTEAYSIDKVTHMEYYSVVDALPKLDLLEYGILDRLERLFAVTGTKPEQIDYQDPAVYGLFRRGDTCGVPEFSHPFCMRLIDRLEEVRFSDLVRVSGMAHGTSVWLENGEELLGEHPFRELIGDRDDVFKTLCHYGLDRKTAYSVMSDVRKGRFADQREQWLAPLEQAGVPQWYIESMKKIRYLFPKAPAADYTRLAVAAAWFKVYHPTAFYNVTLEDLEAAAFLDEPDRLLQQRLAELEEADHSKDRQRDAILLLLEARARRIPLKLNA